MKMSENENLNIQIPSLKEAGEYGNEFPALDFKFRNSTTKPKLIKRMTIKVIEAKLDITPSLEYSVEAIKGDLVLVVNNYGYGSALNFQGKIDLSCFQKSVMKEPLITIKASRIEEQEVFQLLSSDEINKSLCPKNLICPPKNVKNHSDSNRIFLGNTRENGLPPLSSDFSFEDEKGIRHNENQEIARIQRGAYDWRNIYLTENGFDYVHYNPGIMYSLLSSSCTYNVLLSPDDTGGELELSIAHQIEAQSFERLWVIIGSQKSAFYKLIFGFTSDSGETMKSPEVNIRIWNPKNTYFSRREGEKVSISELQMRYPRMGEQQYDYKKLMLRKSRGWGY